MMNDHFSDLLEAFPNGWTTEPPQPAKHPVKQGMCDTLAHPCKFLKDATDKILALCASGLLDSMALSTAPGGISELDEIMNGDVKTCSNESTRIETRGIASLDLIDKVSRRVSPENLINRVCFLYIACIHKFTLIVQVQQLTAMLAAKDNIISDLAKENKTMKVKTTPIPSPSASQLQDCTSPRNDKEKLVVQSQESADELLAKLLQPFFPTAIAEPKKRPMNGWATYDASTERLGSLPVDERASTKKVEPFTIHRSTQDRSSRPKSSSNAVKVPSLATVAQASTSPMTISKAPINLNTLSSSPTSTSSSSNAKSSPPTDYEAKAPRQTHDSISYNSTTMSSFDRNTLPYTSGADLVTKRNIRIAGRAKELEEERKEVRERRKLRKQKTAATANDEMSPGDAEDDWHGVDIEPKEAVFGVQHEWSYDDVEKERAVEARMMQEGREKVAPTLGEALPQNVSGANAWHAPKQSTKPATRSTKRSDEASFSSRGVLGLGSKQFREMDEATPEPSHWVGDRTEAPVQVSKALFPSTMYVKV